MPPERLYREVSPGHAVQIWGPEWDTPSELMPDVPQAATGHEAQAIA